VVGLGREGKLGEGLLSGRFGKEVVSEGEGKEGRGRFW